MALSKIDVANMLTGVTPVANGGTAATTLAGAGLQRPNAKPLMTNGDMAVAQRGTSATGKTTGDTYTVDRMALLLDAQGTYTVAQESLTSGNAFDNGFANAFRIDCTTADASPAASDQLGLQYKFEGQELQVFKKGTANAEKFTLAFWVKSNKTGTGNIQLKDKDNSNRQCTQSYTISSADTWEHKICVFGADTTGAFDDDNAKSLIINWYLGSGTDSSSGTANHGTWEAQDQTKVNDGGTLNINDNTANDWAITGIQLEVGEFTSSTLPPFQFETFGDNLARCQRYYYFHVSEGINNDTDTTISLSSQYNSSSVKGFITFPTRMRATPSLKQNTGTNMYRVYENGSNATFTTLTLSGESTRATGCFTAGSSVSVTAGSCGALQTMDGTAFVAFDAEL
jgi:hypothetical protein